MISNKVQRVEKYLLIDRCGEGYGFVLPAEGEVFMGIPYSWYEASSQPFIEVIKNGKIVRTINCADIAEIVFADSNVRHI